MNRRTIVSFVCAAIVLVLSAPAGFAQQSAQLPKLNPFMHPTKDPNTAAGAALKAALESGRTKAGANANSSNNNGQLQTFTYTVTSSRDGNTYSGQIVGQSPFTNPHASSDISSQLIPVIVRTHTVFTGFNAAGTDITTKPGVTVFDPTVKDDSCLTPPNDVPLTLTQLSPIYKSFDFNFGGTDVGTTQTTDAFQRGNFFKLLNGDPNVDNNLDYHVILSPVNTLAAVVIDIPAGNGIAYPSSVFGGCPGGTVGIVDIAVYEPALFKLFTPLTTKGVNPTTFPFFLEHNVVECEAFAPGVNCGDVLNPNAACCIIGFHDSDGAQTFGTGDFDTSEIFVSPIPDVLPISHEVGEWMNDPFGNNPTPAWGHVGQVGGCQGNLEVGDPLTPTPAPTIFNPVNGFTYHMQELAFFSWFYGAPSVGVHGWFSDNGTFLHDAGPVCH
jgi:hypothetical protein